MPEKRQLVTENDVRRMDPGVRELVLGAGRIATPAALDLAFSRGMRIVYRDEAPGATGSGVPSSLWERIKAADGTYVVHVEHGRAVVTRIGPDGPEPFGAE